MTGLSLLTVVCDGVRRLRDLANAQLRRDINILSKLHGCAAIHVAADQAEEAGAPQGRDLHEVLSLTVSSRMVGSGFSNSMASTRSDYASARRLVGASPGTHRLAVGTRIEAGQLVALDSDGLAYPTVEAERAVGIAASVTTEWNAQGEQTEVVIVDGHREPDELSTFDHSPHPRGERPADAGGPGSFALARAELGDPEYVDPPRASAADIERVQRLARSSRGHPSPSPIMYRDGVLVAREET